MRITWLPDAERRPRHVAVGEFDGVHRGHREVMRGADTVLTFEPHPRTVVSPDSAPLLLTTRVPDLQQSPALRGPLSGGSESIPAVGLRRSG